MCILLYTYVDEAGVVSLAKVVEDTGLIQIRQTCHVLNLLKLWRIHLLRGVQVHLHLLDNAPITGYQGSAGAKQSSMANVRTSGKSDAAERAAYL